MTTRTPEADRNFAFTPSGRTSTIRRRLPRRPDSEGSVYKLLLCWRYLRTRFLALACIISVTLGVATLIVVHSVMSGFSEKLRTNLHGLLSDIVIESDTISGFSDPKAKMAKIMADPFLAGHIEA